MQKGGTQALTDFISLNPKVKAAVYEIHYFDLNYDKVVDWYISKMKRIGPNSGEIAIEKTPAYFPSSETPARVYETNPNVRLLLILRDPVERLISDYNHDRHSHIHRSKQLKQGKKYPTLEEFVFTHDDKINTSYSRLQASIYYLHLSRWLVHFPLEQIHIVHGEKLIETPWAEVNKVGAFLNITSEASENKRFYCATKTLPRNSKRYKDISQTISACLDNSKGRPKPPIAEGTMEGLSDFFKPHTRMFYDLVNREFGWLASDK